MLTVRAAAQRIGCSRQTVRNLIRTGRLPATRRLGNPRGAWLIAELALMEFTEAAAEAGGAAA